MPRAVDPEVIHPGVIGTSGTCICVHRGVLPKVNKQTRQIDPQHRQRIRKISSKGGTFFTTVIFNYHYDPLQLGPDYEIHPNLWLLESARRRKSGKGWSFRLLGFPLTSGLQPTSQGPILTEDGRFLFWRPEGVGYNQGLVCRRLNGHIAPAAWFEDGRLVVVDSSLRH